MTRELKYSVLEKQREEKYSILEKSREESVANLKAYGLEYTSGFGNLNFISMMKNALRNDEKYIYKIDNFDDYSQEFFDAVKDFQLLKGLKVTGVLDMETIVAFDKSYPNAFSYEVKAKLNDYHQRIEKDTKNVSKTTKVELATQEADLVEVISGVPKNVALDKAKKTLNLSGTVSEMQTQILNIQEEYKFEPKNGKIDKKIMDLIEDLEYFKAEHQKALESKNLSKEFQNKVLENMDKYPMTSRINVSSIYFLNETLKPILQKEANFDKDYADFYKKIEQKQTEYKNSPQGQADKKQAEEKGRSVVGVLKDMANGKIQPVDAIKQIATNPGMLLIGGTVFLFGMFGTDKSTATNTWYKRVGLLLVGTIAWPLVPYVAKQLGIDEGFKDLSDGVKKARESSKSSDGKTVENQAREGTRNFINGSISWVENRFNDMSKSASSSDNSAEVSEQTKKGISDAMNSVNQTLGKVYDANNALKNSKNEKEREKAVVEIDLFKDSLTNDEKFANTEVSTLKRIKDDVSAIKGHLSDKTKNELFPENLDKAKREAREKDLKNYVALLLDLSKDDSVFVSDILISEKSIFTSFADKLSEYHKYFEDEELNSEVQKMVSGLSDAKRNKVSWMLSARSGEENAKNKNKLEEILNEKDLSESDRKIITKLKDFYFIKAIYDRFFAEIDKVDNSKGDKAFEELEQIVSKYNDQFRSNGSFSGKSANESYIILFRNKKEEKLASKKLEIKQNSDLSDKNKKQVENLATASEFNKNFSEIGTLPKNLNLGEYQGYVTEAKMLKYVEVIDVYEKELKKYEVSGTKQYRLPAGFESKNGVIKYDGKTEVDAGLRDILVKGSEADARFNELGKNLNKLIGNEAEKIESLAKEIENASKNPNLFKAKEASFISRLSEISDRIYPTKKPEGNLDISGWIDYLRDSYKESVFGVLVSNMKIVDQNFKSNSEQRLLASLTKLKNTLGNKSAKVNEQQREGRQNELIVSKPDLFEKYKNFYNAVPDNLPNNLKSRLINPNDAKMSEMSLEDLIGYTNSFSKRIVEYNKTNPNNKIDIDPFNSKYKELSDLLQNYTN